MENYLFRYLVSNIISLNYSFKIYFNMLYVYCAYELYIYVCMQIITYIFRQLDSCTGQMYTNLPFNLRIIVVNIPHINVKS